MAEDIDSALWIRNFRRAADAEIQLVCFPHAGGSASYFGPLARALPSDIGVLSVQYPGRQDRRREQPIGNIAELADRVTEALRPWLTSGQPLAFFGHSMGAVVAFETVRRMERQEAAGPVMLFASGRRGPGVYREECVHLGGDRSLIAEMKQLNGTRSSLLSDDELLQMILPALRNDYRAIETYSCRPPDATVTCPITALIGASDPRVTTDDARAWSRHTLSPFDIQIFPGGHFYLDQQVQQTADRVSTDLRRFLAASATRGPANRGSEAGRE